MWIEKTRNGKFKAVERFIDTYGKTRRVSITIEKNTAQSRKLAQVTLETKIKNILEKQDNKRRKISLKECIDLYLSEKEKTVKESTLLVLKNRYSIIMEIFGEDFDIRDFTAGIIRSSLLGTGKNDITLDVYLSFLKSIIKWAYKNDFIDDINFLLKLDRFSNKKRIKIEDKFLESDEAKRLIESLNNETYKNLSMFMLLTGTRFGEAVALTAEDIDLKNRTININKNHQIGTKKTAPPKTETSIRKIYIQNELFDLCKILKKKALENKLRYGSSLIFQKNGKHIAYSSFNDVLVRRGEKILGKKITSHFFRHTHVSLLAEQGLQLDAISRRLGHESDEITKAVYFHVTSKLKEKENKAIENIKIL